MDRGVDSAAGSELPLDQPLQGVTISDTPKDVLAALSAARVSSHTRRQAASSLRFEQFTANHWGESASGPPSL